MTVAITCAGCRRTLRVAENLIGQTVRCPLCIETFLAVADPNQPAPIERPAPRKRAIVETAVAVESQDVAVAIVEDDDLESEPPSQPQRSIKPFKPIPFSVFFGRDPDRLFRGRAEAELSADGLRIRLRSRRDLWVTIGSPHPVRYLGGNRIAVFLDGREVVLSLARTRTNLDRLARDAVAMLNGERMAMNGRDYALPWKLTLIPWLAATVPFLAIWLRVLGGIHGGSRFLWFLVAGLALLLGVKLMRREALSNRRRVVVAATAAGFCFLLLGGAFAYRLVYPLTVPASVWQTFTPPGQRCRILMPGTPPPPQHRPVGGIVNTFVYSVDVGNLDKHFSVSVGTLNRVEDPRSDLEKCRCALETEILTYGVPKMEPIRLRSGEPGIQLVITLTGNSLRGDMGMQVTRLFLSGDQLFTLSVRGEDLDPDDPDVKKFFDSFEIGKAAVAASPKELPGVVAYWSFDNVNQKPLDRTQYVGVAQTMGIRHGAVSLTGWASYVNFDRVPQLDFEANQPFSCVGWFKADLSEKFAYVLCLTQERRLVPGGLHLYLENRRLTASLGTEGADSMEVIGNANRLLDSNTWHHFALTRNENGLLNLYLDGEPIANKQSPTFAGALRTTLRSFGCRRTSALVEQPPDSFMNGSLDEAAFFNRCLTAEEITQLARTE